MSAKHYLVTGGSGFLGSALVRALLAAGHRVRVLDNHFRGSAGRLAELEGELELVEADIRDPGSVTAACRGVDCVCHLAYINGTEFFYSQPELVLEVAVKGMMNVLDGCRAAGVGELVLASSSEVYQTPPRVPTDEKVPLSVPDVHNPRYSYGGGKIISELLALNYGRKYFQRVVVFRPHNVYGPDMGREHVIPQFALRMRELFEKQPSGVVDFPLQGDGSQRRAFIYIEDFTAGLMLVLEKGEHLGIYHIGTSQEVSMAQLARLCAAWFGREIRLIPGPLPPGGTPRRCPDVTRLQSLGFSPRVSLEDGLDTTLTWYVRNADAA